MNVNVREVGCEDGRWMELDMDCGGGALVLMVLNLWALLPEAGR
jgi:hypothetical protein